MPKDGPHALRVYMHATPGSGHYLSDLPVLVVSGRRCAGDTGVLQARW